MIYELLECLNYSSVEHFGTDKESIHIPNLVQ